MKFLYPHLIEKGILIIDDFGHGKVPKKAILQYFEEISANPRLTELTILAEFSLSKVNLPSTRTIFVLYEIIFCISIYPCIYFFSQSFCPGKPQ
jgi:hypothetical protein